jgi:hypothetical protein
METKIEQTNYRGIYGKLFADMTYPSGAVHLTEIEHALDKSFLESQKELDLKGGPLEKTNPLNFKIKNEILRQLAQSKIYIEKNMKQTMLFRPKKAI